MKYAVQFIVIIALALTGERDIIGRTYEDAIQGTNLDPALLSRNKSAVEDFLVTINGPQKPAIPVDLDGRKLAVFETCMRMLCSVQHSVIAIDQKTGEQYAAVYTLDGTKSILIDAPFGNIIDQACEQVTCSFNPVRKGEIIALEPLSDEDVADLSGGAYCAAYDKSRNLVLHSEGIAKMRWRGSVVTLSEDGIGTDTLYSVGDHPALKIEIEKTASGSYGYERYESTAILTILDEKEFRWFSVFVTLECES